MGTVASQITSLTIVYSTVYRTQIKENIKAPRHWPVCWDFTGTGEFPAQQASNAENVSIWWRHHDQTNCDSITVQRPMTCFFNTFFFIYRNAYRKLFIFLFLFIAGVTGAFKHIKVRIHYLHCRTSLSPLITTLRIMYYIYIYVCVCTCEEMIESDEFQLTLFAMSH